MLTSGTKWEEGGPVSTRAGSQAVKKEQQQC